MQILCVILRNLGRECADTDCVSIARRAIRQHNVPMLRKSTIPLFVSAVTILLGCYDLLRGFMHTMVLNYSATHIAGLDLTTSTATDQLRLLGAFGISNLETGVALILVGLYARNLALAMLGLIPTLYLIGAIGMNINTQSYPPSQSNWGGFEPMLIYLSLCAITFFAGVIVMRRNQRRSIDSPRGESYGSRI